MSAHDEISALQKDIRVSRFVTSSTFRATFLPRMPSMSGHLPALPELDLHLCINLTTTSTDIRPDVIFRNEQQHGCPIDTLPTIMVNWALH